MMQKQRILSADNSYADLDQYLSEIKVKNIFFVCGNSAEKLNIGHYFQQLCKRMGINMVQFSDFSPNPCYESVVRGVRLFNENDCDSIIALGGGSAIDVAKCIKLYSRMNPEKSYLMQEIILNTIPLIAVPTTAGTGSEATKYAVIYDKGNKQSVTSESCIPQAVLFDPGTLDSLPEYHRKAAMLDALCHAIESYWSVNSTAESQEYAGQAIRLIMENKDAYLAGQNFAERKSINMNMLNAAFFAGKAINLTQTTAGHAMCYKLTALYGIAHGHAAALCVEKLWPFMLDHVDECVDVRGISYLEQVFHSIADAMGCADAYDAAKAFSDLLHSLALPVPKASEKDYEVLRKSVNPVRLKNHPIRLTEEQFDMLYHQIVQ